MPTLSDLFGITSGAINTTPQRMRNLPPAPVKLEWDIRSGLPEPGLERVTPEEWLPPGAGMKLAALAKGGIAPLAAGIMKNKGGVWTEDSIPYWMRENWRKVSDNRMKDPFVAADIWASGPLKNYITRDMATEGDPIRALAEQGITHLRSDQTNRVPGINKQLIAEDRVSQGFPPGETAKTKLGKIWERIADSSVIPTGKNKYDDTVFHYLESGRDATPSMNSGLTNLRHVVEDGIRRGTIDRGSAIRGNFTVADAVRLADKERRAIEAAAAAPDVFKEYPDTGHKWVQLNKPGQFAHESDVMAHSVRGYEPAHLGGSSAYGQGGFPAIESGKAKIFSLRDPNGKAKVTVEMVRLPDGSYQVSQIKGRANTAPKPEYNQMIEDLKRQFEQ